MNKTSEDRIQEIVVSDLRLLEQLLVQRTGIWDQAFEGLIAEARAAAIKRIQDMLPDVDVATIHNSVVKSFQKFVIENGP